MISEDNENKDPINYSFVEFQNCTNGDPLGFIFLSARTYIEREYKIKVTVAAHPKLEKGALGVLTNNEKSYMIFVSPSDVEAHPLFIRYAVAHELGHVICRHLSEMRYLVEKGYGKSGSETSTEYDAYRFLQEEEAEIFAMNMLLAYGAVAERQIPSDAQFLNHVGDSRRIVNAFGKDEHDSILNDSAFRKRMRQALRSAGYIKEPQAFLCHTLKEILGDNLEFTVNGQVYRRDDLAVKIHKAYRDHLQKNEKTESRPSSKYCEGCRYWGFELCFYDIA